MSHPLAARLTRCALVVASFAVLAAFSRRPAPDRPPEPVAHDASWRARLAPSAGGEVIVRVVSEGGEVLHETDVALEGVTGTPVTLMNYCDARGVTRLSAPVGAYRAQAFSEGMISEVLENIVVEAGSRQEIAIRLRPARGSEGETTDSVADGVGAPIRTASR